MDLLPFTPKQIFNLQFEWLLKLIFSLNLNTLVDSPLKFLEEQLLNLPN